MLFILNDGQGVVSDHSITAASGSYRGFGAAGSLMATVTADPAHRVTGLGWIPGVVGNQLCGGRHCLVAILSRQFLVPRGESSAAHPAEGSCACTRLASLHRAAGRGFWPGSGGHRAGLRLPDAGRTGRSVRAANICRDA